MKKALAILLTVTMMMSIFTAFDLGIVGAPMGEPISTVSEFLNMKADGVYYLTQDLDFSGKTYTGNVYTREFKGILDGNGHALLGITIKAQNGDTGIFSNGFNGTLKNLTIGSEEKPAAISSTGSSFSVAAIAGTMKGGAVIEGCKIYADVKGDGKTSGITSYLPSGTITVTDTEMHGSVTGNPAAGFFALSYDGSSNIIIRNSANYATVTAKNLSAGGFYTVHASSSGSRSGSVVITGSANYGSVTATDWRAGGIVGEFHENASSTLTVDYCYNMGRITMTGSGGFAAGIVGGAAYKAPTGKRTVSHVFNGGLVENTATPSNAFEIAFSNISTTMVKVENAAYLNGVATKNVAEEGVTLCDSPDSLVKCVTAYGESAEGNRFVAPISGDNNGYPMLAHQMAEHTNLQVFDCGRKICLDCGKRVSRDEEENHVLVTETVAASGYRDGYEIATCSACGATAKTLGEASAYRPTLTEGVYQIASADHLKWYQVNLAAGLLDGRESLALTSDIDLKGEAFTPIGTRENPFSGNLDGAGHTVSGLKVTAEEEGGLFGVIANTASISMLTLKDPTVEAAKDAGALFGVAADGAYAKIQWILITGATVKSEGGAAGALAGNTRNALLVKMAQCVADGATVTGGESAGGLIGNGNTVDLKNSFVNATVSVSSGLKTGALAYYTAQFSQSASGYVKTANFTKRDGSIVTAEDFASGAVANLVNTYACEKVLGCDGKTVTMGDPLYAVYYGEAIKYTSSLLDDEDAFAVYTDGKTVAIAVKRDNGPRLTDLPIKLTADGKEVTLSYSDLTLTRRVIMNGKVFTVDADTALYVVSLANVTACTVGDTASTPKTVG